MFVVCQWPNASIFGSMDLFKLEIHQKCVVHMRSSGLDWPRGKKMASGTLPSKLMLNGPSRLGVVVCDGCWVLQALLPPPPSEPSEPP